MDTRKLYRSTLLEIYLIVQRTKDSGGKSAAASELHVTEEELDKYLAKVKICRKNKLRSLTYEDFLYEKLDTLNKTFGNDFSKTINDLPPARLIENLSKKTLKKRAAKLQNNPTDEEMSSIINSKAVLCINMSDQFLNIIPINCNVMHITNHLNSMKETNFFNDYESSQTDNIVTLRYLKNDSNLAQNFRSYFPQAVIANYLTQMQNTTYLYKGDPEQQIDIFWLGEHPININDLIVAVNQSKFAMSIKLALNNVVKLSPAFKLSLTLSFNEGVWGSERALFPLNEICVWLFEYTQTISHAKRQKTTQTFLNTDYSPRQFTDSDEQLTTPENEPYTPENHKPESPSNK